MTTLADELEQLNKHREDLERRIKEEELQRKVEMINLNTLQQTNVMTAPRFEVILEILKKQDARIRELENVINSQ